MKNLEISRRWYWIEINFQEYTRRKFARSHSYFAYEIVHVLHVHDNEKRVGCLRISIPYEVSRKPAGGGGAAAIPVDRVLKLTSAGTQSCF